MHINLHILIPSSAYPHVRAKKIYIFFGTIDFHYMDKTGWNIVQNLFLFWSTIPLSCNPLQIRKLVIIERTDLKCLAVSDVFYAIISVKWAWPEILVCCWTHYECVCCLRLDSEPAAVTVTVLYCTLKSRGFIFLGVHAKDPLPSPVHPVARLACQNISSIHIHSDYINVFLVGKNVKSFWIVIYIYSIYMPYLKCTEALCPLGFWVEHEGHSSSSHSSTLYVYTCAFISSDPKLTTELLY